MRLWCEVRLKPRFRAFHRNGFVMRGRIFENVHFFENIEAGERFGHPKSQIFFAGTNFSALWRAHVSYYDVIRRAVSRRVIPLPG